VAEAEVGSAVISKAGRDKGSWLLVVGAEDGYVYLADGGARKLIRPKKKKLTHVQPTNHASDDIKGRLESGLYVSDADIRKFLSALEGGTDGVQERRDRS
jgi:ribosomal protein L14E/L6E/L27E